MSDGMEKWKVIQAFEHFGAKTSNKYAWSAQSPDGNITVLNLWIDEMNDDGTHVIVDLFDHPRRDDWVDRPGNMKRTTHLRDVWAGDKTFRVVMLRAENTQTSPRRATARWPDDGLVMTLTNFNPETGEFRAEGKRERAGSRGLKYDPLGTLLRNSNEDEIQLLVSEIEDLVGKLPNDSRSHQFWANTGHHHARRSQWLNNGYKAFFKPREDMVLFKKHTLSGAWTEQELRACVVAYHKLWLAEIMGKRMVKAQLRREIIDEALPYRTETAYERRMQNISAVVEELGMTPVKGYVPLRNIGKPKRIVVSLINEIWQRDDHREQPTADSTELATRVSAAMQKTHKSEDPPKGSENVGQVGRQVKQFMRSPDVIAWVLGEAEGVCEACDRQAPFSRADGTPYLEVHHVRHLAEGGPDTTDNAVALCPNCHRRLHSSGDKTSFRRKVIALVPRVNDYPKKPVDAVIKTDKS